MDIKMIESAAKDLSGVVTRTPMVNASLLQPNLWIKSESLQVTGSFKIRGAYNRMLHLTTEQKEAGVIAASAGNHAQGVAYACQVMGISGTIVMPKTAPLAKIEATKSYGVDVQLQGDTFNDAYEYAKNLREIQGSTFIEPFDDEYVVAGQGTIGLEIIEKMPDVEYVFVPIGGGGLMAGIATAIKALNPDIKVIGVEAANAASMKAALEQEHIVTLDTAGTIADGIAVKRAGEVTYDLCKAYVDEVVTVSEDEIAATMLLLLEKMKMVAEGAGATAIAAALYHKVDTRGKKSVAVLSGGNVDVSFLSKIIELGLYKTGRKLTMDVILVDKPGYLTKVLDVINKLSPNIISIEHIRNMEAVLGHECRVRFVLETTGPYHCKEIEFALKAEGYEVEVL